MSGPEIAEQFQRQGFALLPGVLPAPDCEALAAAAAPSATLSGGTRTLLTSPWCAALAARLRAHPLLAALLPPQARAVQCTYFEKSVDRNWLVTWHQDLGIPVTRRVAHPELKAWSTKEGVPHVQPPAAVLRQLAAVRLHLDDCAPQSGPLRVIPGSHAGGVLPEGPVDDTTALACPAPLGSALVMRPLLLHASSKARAPGRRRVLHLLFGPPELPHGLRWHQAV